MARPSSKEVAAAVEVLRRAEGGLGVIAAAANQPAAIQLEDLSGIEQAAVALQADPDAVKPIEWLNKKHYEALQGTNALAPELERRIEAYCALQEDTKVTA